MAIKQGIFTRKTFAGICWGLALAIPVVVLGQTNYYTTNGTEYAIVGSLLGDQVHPDVAVNTNGGFVVWQDNITDGDGWGVSAMRLNSTLAGSGSSFRVNVQGAGDQDYPRVALLQGGGAVFVWQGGPQGFQHIYARFLSSSNTWLTGDVLVNASTNYFQIHPAVATLANGNVIIVWASYNEASSTSMQDVYGRIFSPTGGPAPGALAGQFLINQFTAYNQRTPTVAALANGGFVVAWVSEQERRTAPSPGNSSFAVTNAVTAPNASVDIYARLYEGSGNPQSDEFLVNSDYNPCADPDVAAGLDGGFMMTWDARDMASVRTNSLDIYARSFTSASPGSGGTVLQVNSYLYGDQFGPRIAALGRTDYLIVWTSLTPQEGVYGQFLRGDGSTVGSQFQVNVPTPVQQIQPVVASDGAGQFLAVWSGFTGLPDSFDLFAQRYINTQQPLEPLPAPFVYAPFMVSNNVYQPQLQVSWPPVAGLSVSDYEIYVDGASTPTVTTTTNVWTMTAANGLTTNSTHSFQVDYVTADGRKSPLSPSASGTTWSGLNWGGIPYEWMAEFFGGYYNGAYHTNFWMSPNAPVAAGGPTLLQVFLSGGNPFDSSTWLQTELSTTAEGLFLSWNTQPGFTYQVQSEAGLGGAWTNMGEPRFAADTNDWIFVGKGSAGYYRVLLLRQ